MTTSPGHRTGFLPHTRMGRGAVGFACLFVVGLGFMLIAVASGQRGGDALWDNWWLGAPALAAGSGALGALFTGVVAMWRDHERSDIVILATALGAIVAAFLIGELLVPH